MLLRMEPEQIGNSWEHIKELLKGSQGYCLTLSEEEWPIVLEHLLKGQLLLFLYKKEDDFGGILLVALDLNPITFQKRAFIACVMGIEEELDQMFHELNGLIGAFTYYVSPMEATKEIFKGLGFDKEVSLLIKEN